MSSKRSAIFEGAEQDHQGGMRRLKHEPELLAAELGEFILGRDVISVPSIVMLREFGESSPAIKPSSVLFQLPDGPMIARDCRDGTSKLMSRMISTPRAPFRIVFTRFRTAIILRF